MHTDVKDVILTLLEARGYLFSVIHTLLGAEPTKEMLSAASSEESLAALFVLEDGEHEALGRLADVLKGLREADCEALSGEYTRLMLGPEELPAPPWESVYRDKNRALFQASTLAVHGWYEQFGFVPAGYPHYPDDHISLMMHFMALTCERAAAALREGRLDAYRNLLAGQLLFEQNHLLSWLGPWAKDMEKSKTKFFYPQFAQAVSDVILYDHDLLLDIMSSEQA